MANNVKETIDARPYGTLIRVGGEEWMVGVSNGPTAVPSDKMSSTSDRSGSNVSKVDFEPIDKDTKKADSDVRSNTGQASAHQRMAMASSLHQSWPNRMEKVWESVVHHFVTSIRSHAQFASDYLQWGVTVGLIIGCLVLVLFEQVSPFSPFAEKPTVSSATVTANVPTMPSLTYQDTHRLGLFIPKTEIWGVEVGEYVKSATALAKMYALRKENVPAYLQFDKKWMVVDDLALFPTDLNQGLAIAKQHHLTVHRGELTVGERRLLLLPQATASNVQDLQKLFDAEQSVLLAFAAVACDGANPANANLDFRNEQSLYSHAIHVIGQTGLQSPLVALQATLLTAQTDLRTHRLVSARAEVADGFLRLETMTGVS
ncbi:MAG: hypothetical protein OWQ59_10725 [Alicyclobacillaceae bacterium]|uniref:hypothetical protein n=1 Tax=Alicyclobacillus sp. SP_1 TaxID=2942475 RepID=UPI00215738A1|nr:hypothetical protein [Alicyclobacillus sp. SP_1]MCY0888913.1 hypothetical protein [Alicyclobacillaceae bacterium]